MSIKKNIGGTSGNLVQTLIGVAFILFAGIWFFIEPIREVSDMVLGVIAAVGLLLILAPNLLVELIKKRADR